MDFVHLVTYDGLVFSDELQILKDGTTVSSGLASLHGDFKGHSFTALPVDNYLKGDQY